MARVSWGGGGDYSSLFAQLWHQQEAEQKAAADQAAYEAKQAQKEAEYEAKQAAKEAEQKAKEEAAYQKELQAAQDADMFDLWNNGGLSSDDLLAYIQKRAGETVGDPSEHEKWVKAYRQYSTAIADSQAEFAYQNGGSFNDYIAYWQRRLSTISPDSNEYRNIALKVNNLLDQRAQQDIATGAEQISAAIQSGAATYQDLLSFYQSKLQTLPAGSDFRAKVEEQIAAVKQQIQNDAIQGAYNRIDYEYSSGKISGVSAGKQLREIADKYYKGNQEQYYKVLNAALQYEKADAAAKEAAAKKAAAAAASKAALDFFQSKEKQVNALVDQYKAGWQTGFDAWTGAPFPFTQANVQALFQAQLDNYDSWAAFYRAKGDYSAMGTPLSKKTDFIIRTIQPANTVAAQEQTRQLMLAAADRLDAAAKSADPTATLSTAQQIADEIEQYAKGLTATTTVYGRKHVAYTTTTALPLTEQPSASYIAQLNAFAKDLRLAATPGAPLDTVDALLKSDVLDGLPSGAVTKIIETIKDQNQQATDLANNKRMYFVGPKGIGTVKTTTVLTPVTTPQGVVMREQTVPDVKVDTANGEQLITVYLQINGVPTPALAIARPFYGYQTYVSNGISGLQVGGKTYNIPKGAPIPDSVLTALGKDQVAALLSQGQIEEKPVDVGLGYVDVPGYTDATGRSFGSTAWYVDMQTGVAHAASDGPLQFVKLRADGTVAIDDNGTPIFNYKPFSTAGGVPLIFVGDTTGARKMQQMWDSGEIKADVRTRGPDGKISATPTHDWGAAYYWELPQEAPLTSQRDTWWSSKDQEALRAATAAAWHDQAKATSQGSASPLDMLGGLFGDLIGTLFGQRPSANQTSQTPVAPVRQANLPTQYVYSSASPNIANAIITGHEWTGPTSVEIKKLQTFTPPPPTPIIPNTTLAKASGGLSTSQATAARLKPIAPTPLVGIEKNRKIAATNTGLPPVTLAPISKPKAV